MAFAYEKNIVPVVQDLVGGMFDFAVYGLGYELKGFYDRFLDSKYCRCVEKADSKTVMGQSGIELTYAVSEYERLDNAQMDEYTMHAISGRSREYWIGWVLSYYQWATSLSYREIENIRDIEKISAMYEVYHEMDVLHFVDKMNALYKEKHPDTRLKQIRTNAGLSQKNLADITQIPVKTIQQYEQRQKNINNASVDYVVRLSRALKCDIEMLLEVETNI